MQEPEIEKLERSARLKEWVESTGIKKKDIAEKLGCSSQMLSDYLHGRANIGFSMQSRLRELGADVDWIMSGRKASLALNLVRSELLAEFTVIAKDSQDIDVEYEKNGDDRYTIKVYAAKVKAAAKAAPEAALAPAFNIEAIEDQLKYDEVTPMHPNLAPRITGEITKAAATPPIGEHRDEQQRGGRGTTAGD